MYKLFLFFLSAGILCAVGTASAQYAAQDEAKYLATVKAVADFKINDEEHLQAVDSLRQNRNFNLKLQGMINKLSNRRTKDTTNRKILKILEQAGKEIYNLLD